MIDIDLDGLSTIPVYWGVQIHTCKSRPEDAEAECEIFRPSRGQVDPGDVPEAVVNPVKEVFSDEVLIPTPDMIDDDEDDEDEGEFPGLPGVVLVSDADEAMLNSLQDPDTDPGGMFQ
jgi:hypothetical protein